MSNGQRLTVEKREVLSPQCGKVVKNTITIFTENASIFPSNQSIIELLEDFTNKRPFGDWE